MSSQPARLEVRKPRGRGLRVEFIRVKDRYAHVISRLEGELAVPVWESVEGTDADDWPPSPPLQQLSLETLPDGRHVALLVGMAGTSHWSLSVEAATGEPAFIFDVACRVKQTPDGLGSKYRPTTAHDSIHMESCSADCDVRADEKEITITPCNLGSSTPCTVRWKYRIAMK